jgi:hypothetical protein
MQDMVKRARAYATAGHQRIDQRRKYTNQPYAVHLKAVAEMVGTVTDDAEMMAAAWLHDIVEDTPITIEALEAEFGPAVAQLVAELTDASKPSDGNRAQRKAIARAKLAKASPRAKTVKLADLIDNCRDICRHDPRFARTFLAEACELWPVLSGGNPKLHRRAREVFLKCAAEIDLPLTEFDSQPTPSLDLDAFQTRALLRDHRRSLRAFARAFSARDIAEPLRSFDRERPRAELFAQVEKHSDPVVGIRDGGVLSHYFYGGVSTRSADRNNLWPIRPDQILEWDKPLYDVALVLTRHDFCFVSALGAIIGVISRADMQKPVVRMWLFGIISFIESEVNARIEARWGETDWIPHVTPSRLEKARELWQERRRRDQPCSLLSCLQMSDKAKILMQEGKALADYGFTSKGAAKRVLKEIESLRNNLAHAQDIVTHDWAQIARLAQNFFRNAWNW